MGVVARLEFAINMIKPPILMISYTNVFRFGDFPSREYATNTYCFGSLNSQYCILIHNIVISRHSPRLLLFDKVFFLKKN